MTNEVTFLGGGSFGTALSTLLAKKGISVKLWDRSPSIVQGININRENKKYLPDVKLPSNVKAYENIKEAVDNSNFIVLSVPSHVVRSLCRQISQFISKEQIVICIAKGIEEDTQKILSEVIEEELPLSPVVILSGPSHAEEVALDIPTAVVAASKHKKCAVKVQDLFMTNTFRVYTNTDLIGVEIGGAVKNIIALASGISDGIGYGDNAKAALMTRGMHEIVKIGTKLGAKKETFSGLTGIGDLIVTCTSMHSRNRRAGILIGQGMQVDEAIDKIGMVVEGIRACRAFYQLKEKLKVSMPITDVLYKILFEGKDPKEAVYELMSRDKKDEIYNL
ncbi:NAD(P)H-dependent glycerol-3-phosphate dehydrogenase [Candidatus Clostridium stratigraminis]|uniref:Glycerol-3-phosphate dehydrogenase [NAD(P)+] n=1 Tax=Candidatus Clostridium stratigraminis TaxID=3381661 RepID=A0ABW8T3H6_9CLOT